MITAENRAKRPEIRKLPRAAALRKGLIQTGWNCFAGYGVALNQRNALPFCDRAFFGRMVGDSEKVVRDRCRRAILRVARHPAGAGRSTRWRTSSLGW